MPELRPAWRWLLLQAAAIAWGFGFSFLHRWVLRSSGFLPGAVQLLVIFLTLPLLVWVLMLTLFRRDAPASADACCEECGGLRTGERGGARWAEQRRLRSAERRRVWWAESRRLGWAALATAVASDWAYSRRAWLLGPGSWASGQGRAAVASDAGRIAIVTIGLFCLVVAALVFLRLIDKS